MSKKAQEAKFETPEHAQMDSRLDPPNTIGNIAEEAISQVADLGPLADGLNSGTNELNSALRSIEKEISKLNLKLEVWLAPKLRLWRSPMEEVYINAQSTEKEYRIKELGYARDGDTWALLVRELRFRSDWHLYKVDRKIWFKYYMGQQRLVDVALQLRTAAVPLIPLLIDELKTEASKALERIGQARELAYSVDE